MRYKYVQYLYTQHTVYIIFFTYVFRSIYLGEAQELHTHMRFSSLLIVKTKLLQGNQQCLLSSKSILWNTFWSKKLLYQNNRKKVSYFYANFAIFPLTALENRCYSSQKTLRRLYILCINYILHSYAQILH